MNIRMKRSFVYEVPGRPGVRRTIPAGWTGELPEEIAEAAEAANAGIIDRPAAIVQPRRSRGRRGRGSESTAPVAEEERDLNGDVSREGDGDDDTEADGDADGDGSDAADANGDGGSDGTVQD